jgi:ribonucleoside-diphosphate reductase alpha chain
VPLRVLCEKFAHTRFEPSGWTGNEQIGYAKSIMDYIFRWIQIRFLSGHQLDLFAGLGPQAQGQISVPVEGTVTDPSSTVILSGAQGAESKNPESLNPGSRSLNPSASNSPDDFYTTTPPQQGIAPDLSARSGLESSTPYSLNPTPLDSVEDRGVYHVADAMKSMYDMGDSPSCATCGAIMTRSGSCYRCMSCGSTSGCS